MRQDKGDSGVEPAISNTSLPSFIIGDPDTSIYINPLDYVSKRHSLDLVGLKPRVIQKRRYFVPVYEADTKSNIFLIWLEHIHKSQQGRNY